MSQSRVSAVVPVDLLVYAVFNARHSARNARELFHFVKDLGSGAADRIGSEKKYALSTPVNVEHNCTRRHPRMAWGDGGLRQLKGDDMWDGFCFKLRRHAPHARARCLSYTATLG